MAFIPTAQCARTALRMSLFGQDVINTLWFSRISGDWDVDSLGDLNGEVVTWWETQIATELSENISLVEVTSIDQQSVTAPSVSNTTLVDGVLTGAAVPGNNCLTVSFRTPNRGRSGRGRNYVSGLREVDVTGNAFDAGKALNLANGYNILVSAPLLSGDAVWVVVSHYTNGAPRAQGLVQAINTAIVVDSNIDSQRRRLTGRGQ